MVKSFQRYERKYVINKEQCTSLLKELRSKTTPDTHCENGDYYPIYNVYFDTPQKNIIRTSVSKPFFKEKLRYRIYDIDSPSDNVSGFLEIKRKTDKIVTKRRIDMTLEEAQAFSHEPLLPGGVSQITDELSYYISRFPDIEPSVCLFYKREAFTAGENRLRITLDSDIRALHFDRFLSFGENLDICSKHGRELIGKEERVLEVKFAGAMPLWVSELLSRLQIYPRSFSKSGTFYTLLTKEKYQHSPASYTSFDSGYEKNTLNRTVAL